MLSSVGLDTPQVTAKEKLLGRAQYAGDIKLPGMLHAKVLRSPYPSARIISMDTSKAKALAGVRLVVSAEDTPTRLSGIHRKEHRIFAAGIVRFVGEEVAAVVAISEDIARDAIDLIEVEYLELPALYSAESALLADAPEVHIGTSNLADEVSISRGDVESGFAQSTFIYEATYETHSQYPGYLVPMATVASMGGDGRLTVWTSTQSVFLARDEFILKLRAQELPVTAADVPSSTATIAAPFGAV